MTLNHVDPKKHYFLACSFGPDSMALFHLLQKQDISFSVLHVNYHRRGEDSNLEERALREYCKQFGIECYVLDTTGLNVTGNFQAWARKLRYRYFRSVLNDHPDAAGVLVAHHQDDVLETYLMQKQSRRLSLYCGIEPVTTIEGVRVIRPLLDYRKNDLLKIVEHQHVPFAIDASNLQNDYTRNRVRHMIVEHLTDSERMDLLSEIKTKNEHNQTLIQAFTQNNPTINQATIQSFLSFCPQDFALVMTYFLKQNGIHKAPSLAKMEEMQRMIQRNHMPNAILLENGPKQLERAYEYLRFVTQEKPKEYMYHLETPMVFECDFLSFDGQNPRNLKRIPLEAYPIAIRPYRPTDQVMVSRYLKKINRLYIDWKMPTSLRPKWPVFVDKNGIIIFVPRYRANYVQQSDNSLILRL